MTLFSEAHEAFRGRVRRFVEEHLTPHAEEWERNGEFPISLFRELGREGFLGLSRPREFGGQGLDFGYNVVLAEELPRSKMMGLTASVLAQTNVFLPLLARLGTNEQKEEFLAGAVRGEKIGALGAAEPTGGSDMVNAVQCTAVDDGDFWVVTGEKKFITNGPIADFVVVLVRTRPQHATNSLSLIIVPTDTPGFSVKERLRKLGLNTCPTGWLTFDGCRVPKRLTLGTPNLGYFYTASNILEERLVIGASSISLAGLVLEDTIRYIQQRNVFGGPLSKLQAVRHTIAEVAADIEMGRRFVHSVCKDYSDGRVEAKEICMIKFRVAQIAQSVVERCLQLHGGYGYLEENWITRIFRDARVVSVFGGPSELMKDLVATYLRL
jgi:alkylation response protein AidB-like acyl-CoA dehydrogenase